MYNLSNDGIKQACGAAESFLAENKIEHRETVRILLLIEEMLLKYKAVFGDGQEYELKTRRTLGRTSISIRLPGIGSDPFSEPDDQENSIIKALNTNLKSAAWSYKNGSQRILCPDRNRGDCRLAGHAGQGRPAHSVKQGPCETTTDLEVAPCPC